MSLARNDKTGVYRQTENSRSAVIITYPASKSKRLFEHFYKKFFPAGNQGGVFQKFINRAEIL